MMKITPETFKEIQQTYEDALQQRAAQIVAMRDIMGWTFDKIGEHFDISKQSAQRIYRISKEREEE